jgi:hypothetical protein
MCFEQLIEKSFWHKQYERRLQRIIYKIEQNFNLNEDERNEINGAFKNRQQHSSKETRIISLILLLFSIFALIYSGIEQSFKINLPIYVSIMILSIIFLPALFIFFEGLLKTNRYAKKIEKIITHESEVLFQVISNNDTNNAAYNRIVTQKINTATDDTLSKSELLSDVIEEFKKQSVTNIKDYICN